MGRPYYPGELVEITDGFWRHKIAYYSHVNPSNPVRVFVDIPKHVDGKLEIDTEEVSIDFITPAHIDTIQPYVKK